MGAGLRWFFSEFFYLIWVFITDPQASTNDHGTPPLCLRQAALQPMSGFTPTDIQSSSMKYTAQQLKYSLSKNNIEALAAGPLLPACRRQSGGDQDIANTQGGKIYRQLKKAGLYPEIAEKMIFPISTHF